MVNPSLSQTLFRHCQDLFVCSRSFVFTTFMDLSFLFLGKNFMYKKSERESGADKMLFKV